MRHLIRVVNVLAVAAAIGGQGAIRAQSADWTEPFPPFRIAGNLYYVGSKGLASYLVATPQGHILINSNLETSPPLIRTSVEKLGFKFTDIKILLISHAHWDHNAGSAAIVRPTNAKYMVMDADVPVVESGGLKDFQYANDPAARYPANKVDRVLHDGDDVRLGDAVLVAHLTPGHTRGCTTWTMKVQESGRTYDAVIIGSPNVNPGYKLVNNAAYPQIAGDYERTFLVLKSLPIDLFLGAHGSYFNMEAKHARMAAAPGNVFVDPDGYRRYVADREQAFRLELAKQRSVRSEEGETVNAWQRALIAVVIGGLSGYVLRHMGRGRRPARDARRCRDRRSGAARDPVGRQTKALSLAIACAAAAGVRAQIPEGAPAIYRE